MSRGAKNSLNIADYAKELLFELRVGQDDTKEDLSIGKVRHSSKPDIFSELGQKVRSNRIIGSLKMDCMEAAVSAGCAAVTMAIV